MLQYYLRFKLQAASRTDQLQLINCKQHRELIKGKSIPKWIFPKQNLRMPEKKIICELSFLFNIHIKVFTDLLSVALEH